MSEVQAATRFSAPHKHDAIRHCTLFRPGGRVRLAIRIRGVWLESRSKSWEHPSPDGSGESAAWNDLLYSRQGFPRAERPEKFLARQAQDTVPFEAFVAPIDQQGPALRVVCRKCLECAEILRTYPHCLLDF